MYCRCKCGRLFVRNEQYAFMTSHGYGHYDPFICEKCNKCLDDEYKAQCEADKANEENEDK